MEETEEKKKVSKKSEIILCSVNYPDGGGNLVEGNQTRPRTGLTVSSDMAAFGALVAISTQLMPGTKEQ